MTTPDEEITGYGGLPKTDPGTTNTASSMNATPSSSTSQSSSTGTSQNASGSVGHATEDVKAKARQAADQVKTQGKSQLEGYRETAADEIEKVAQSAKAAAQELEGQDRLGLSNYVSDMAQNMVQFSDSLRGKSVDELLQDVNRLARNNPALFITGSIALGFGLTRFARASGKRATRDEYGHRDNSTSFSSSGSQYGSSHDDNFSDQSELNDRLSTGEPGTIGSISNAGVSSATSTSRSTTGAGTGVGTGIGTGSVTGPGTGPGSSGTGSGAGANTSNGLGIGTHSTSGVGSNTGRDGKGTDGGLFP
ncbi:hypothetical protein D7241_18200 [Stutzerimonas sp. VN223-3]|uniref:hypothetical protein n=1 Tax=Stutzerimonas sp. VN223-3 TaxID=3384601 RepID=UPI0038B4218A